MHRKGAGRMINSLDLDLRAKTSPEDMALDAVLSCLAPCDFPDSVVFAIKICSTFCFHGNTSASNALPPLMSCQATTDPLQPESTVACFNSLERMVDSFYCRKRMMFLHRKAVLVFQPVHGSCCRTSLAAFE